MKTKFYAITLFLTALSLPAFGANKMKSGGMKPMAEISAAQREEMAATHEKMAVCLRSDKAIEDCHKEMMHACQSTMGKGGCPMMGKMGKMHSMMDKNMMHDQASDKEDESGQAEEK